MLSVIRNEEFQSAKKEGAGIITRLADSFHNMSASLMIKNRTPEFSDITNYVYAFGEKLTTMERISQRIAKEECGKKKNKVELSLEIHLLRQ